jgi:hypothetical protein
MHSLRDLEIVGFARVIRGDRVDEVDVEELVRGVGYFLTLKTRARECEEEELDRVVLSARARADRVLAALFYLVL